MEDLLNKESVQRVVKVLNNFDASLKVEVLNSSARTAKDAAISLKCEVGAIVKSLLLKTEGNFIEYICKVLFEHIIFTEPVPVLKAACADSMVAPVNSFCPPYTTTLPLLYLCPNAFFQGKYFFQFENYLFCCAITNLLHLIN